MLPPKWGNKEFRKKRIHHKTTIKGILWMRMNHSFLTNVLKNKEVCLEWVIGTQVLISSNQGLATGSGGCWSSWETSEYSAICHTLCYTNIWQHPHELLHEKGQEVSQKALREMYSERQNWCLFEHFDRFTQHRKNLGLN